MTNHVIEVFQRRLKRTLQMFRVIPLWHYPKAFLFLTGSAVYQVLSFIWGGTLANRLLGKHRQTLTIVQTKFRFSLVGGDLGVVFDCLIDGMYEKKTEFIPHDGAVCLDIGANIGACLAVWYRRCKPHKVIAAEPHPVTCERLRYNAALNRWNGLEIIEAAISDQEGEIVISLTPEGSMAVVGAHSAHQCIVPTTTIDALVKQRSLTIIDLCKIDVEGHEMKVLDGARETLPRTRRLIIEYHTHDLREAILHRLEDSFHIVGCDRSKIGLLYAINRSI